MHENLPLVKYWFQFDHPTDSMDKLSFGVTAYNYEDAINLIRDAFEKSELPPIKSFFENTDVFQLDEAGNPIYPENMPGNFRGIWFPKGLGLANK